MTKFRVEAQADPEEDQVFGASQLEHLYELMYKYGWYKLYDKASAKFIEPSLKSLLQEGIEHLENTFEKWLQEHVLPGWWDERFGVNSGDPDDPYVNAVETMKWKAILSNRAVFDWILSHANRAQMIRNEINDGMGYFEAQALEFLKEKYPENEELEEMSDWEALQYIDVNALHAEFENYIVNETDIFSPEDLSDIYGETSMSEAMENLFLYGIVRDNEEEFINWLYQKFVDHFDLQPIIEDIQEALEYMKSVDNNSIEEMIAAFNKGLTTAHYGGKMSEHFADYLDSLGSNISTKLLDSLSQGDYNKQWDYELKKEGIPIGAKRRVVPNGLDDMKMRVEAQDFTPTPEGMYAEVSALYQALLEAKGKYSTVTIMRYTSNALDLRYLVSVVLDPSSPDTIFTSEENVYIEGRIDEFVDKEILFLLTFPTLNTNYDDKLYNFMFKFDVQNNIIKPLSHKYWNKDLTPSELLLGVEEVLQEEIQRDFNDNTDPKVKEILLEKDSNFVNDCGIEPMTKEITNWWIQNLYSTLILQKPTGVQISLWETLFSGFEFEKEPQYIKTALWRVLKEDMERYLPGIISGVLKDNPTIIDIGNQLISFKARIKDVLEPLTGTEYVFDETNYNRMVLHKRIPDEFKPKEPKYYVHIMNEVVKDPVRYVKEFMQLTGEVAASDLVDEFYKTHKNTLAVVLYGLANAEFPHDVYSHINEETGLRELGQQRGEERTEAWLIPSQTQLIGVITDIPGFPEKLQAAKIPLYDVDITSLQPEMTEGVWYDKAARIKVIKDRMQEIENGMEAAFDNVNRYENAVVHPDNQKSHDAWIDSNKKYLEELEKEYKDLEYELKLYMEKDPEFYQFEDVSKQFGLEFYGKKARLRVLAEKVRVECE